MTASASSTTAWYAMAAILWQCRCQCVVQCFGFGPYRQLHQRVQVQDGVQIANCSPQISDSTSRNNTLSGFYASGSGTPIIRDNRFTDNGQLRCLPEPDGDQSPLISGNTGSGNQINALVFRRQCGLADQTWTSTPGFPIVL